MSYQLLDRPNPHGPFYYTSRRTCKHGVPPSQLPHLIVIHTAESQPDIHGADTGAEGISNYASTTTRSVSWHTSIDSDSEVPVLPDSYVAFHVRGYNTCSIGVEIATQAHKWESLPEAWKDAVYRNVRSWVIRKCTEHGIPPKLISRFTADQGGRGIIGHRHLDPSRRTDPGDDFEWGRILSSEQEEEMLKKGDNGPAVKVFQRAIIAWKKRDNGLAGVKPKKDGTLWEKALYWKDDGDFGQTTEDMVKEYQRAAGLPQTGTIGGITASLLSRYDPVTPSETTAHPHPYAAADHTHNVVNHLAIASKSDTATIAKAVAGELKIEGSLQTGDPE